MAGFLVTIPLYTGFDPSTAALQFVENVPWIDRYKINYFLGVDGISMVCAAQQLHHHPSGCRWLGCHRETTSAVLLAAFLIMSSGLINGSFAAADAVLFLRLFEAMLIPMYLIIGIWGGPESSVRRDQVLSLHAARLVVDAGGTAVSVQRHRWQLQ